MRMIDTSKYKRRVKDGMMMKIKDILIVIAGYRIHKNNHRNLVDSFYDIVSTMNSVIR